MAKTLTDEPNNGWWIEFRRGWWARCLGPNKDCKERGETSATYHGSVTEEDAKELEKRVGDFLGKRGWPDGDAQVEIMRGGADVKITVDGSTHVRSVREWHALAVASFRSVPTADAHGAPDLGEWMPVSEDRIYSVIGERFKPESDDFRKARKAVWALLHEARRAYAEHFSKARSADADRCPACGMDAKTVREKGCYDDRCRYEMAIHARPTDAESKRG